MTQRLVLELLRELGGKATTRDILNFAKLNIQTQGLKKGSTQANATSDVGTSLNELWSIVDK
jgi:hypothetical protein